MREQRDEDPAKVLAWGNELSQDAARVLIESAKLDLGAAFAKMVAAYQGRAWKSLGYRSWAALHEANFTDVASLALPPGERLDQVVEGLSASAAAAAPSRRMTTSASDESPRDEAERRISELEADSEGWKVLLVEASEYLPAVASFEYGMWFPFDSEGHPWVEAYDAASMAQACATLVERPDQFEQALDRSVDDPPEFLRESFAYAARVRCWPVVIDYLRLVELHGYDLLDELFVWGRDLAEVGFPGRADAITQASALVVRALEP